MMPAGKATNRREGEEGANAQNARLAGRIKHAQPIPE